MDAPVHRPHRHSHSVPIPPSRHRPSHSMGGKSFPRSRTMPVTSPIPAAALHAMDDHPRGMTSGGILASSPEKRFDPLRPPRPRSLMFDRSRDVRRASYPPEEPPASERDQIETVSPQSILEPSKTGAGKRYSPLPGAEEALASGVQTRSVSNDGDASQAPAWAAALMSSLSRLEARQERLEEMLMPTEGD
jgi:hypothetical protein